MAWRASAGRRLVLVGVWGLSFVACAGRLGCREPMLFPFNMTAADWERYQSLDSKAADRLCNGYCDPLETTGGTGCYPTEREVDENGEKEFVCEVVLD